MRHVLEDSFIIVRDEGGQVRALFNMCLHRGMQVCRAEIGNASHFRCPYHGWSYRNDGRLVGLPFHRDAYGGEAGYARKDQTLLPAPAMDIYNGMIFVSLDPNVAPLKEFLGDFAFYLDYYTRQSPDGIELRGPQRWRIKANWKIGAENFAGDMYHTPHTHSSVVEIGLFREPKAEKRKDGTTYWATSGGGTTYKLPPGDFDERLRYVGYPAEMVERMGALWSTEQQRVIGSDGFMISAATVFPNLSFVHNWPRVGESDDVLPFISLRQWQPISAGRDRGALVVRRRQERAGALQGAVLQGLPHVLREHRHVRAGRRRELGLPHQHRRGIDGPAAAAQQPDGPVAGRHHRRPPADRRAVERSRIGVRRLRRVQPAGAAPAVGRLPRAPGGEAPWTPAPAAATSPNAARPGRATRRRARRAHAALAFDDHRHLTAHRWLVDEAYLLDTQDYATWLTLLTEDIRYVMPVRVTTALAAGFDTARGMAHFDEDKYSLDRRVARFATEHAWTEDPPSRLRHHVGNVRTFATDRPDDLEVQSSVLLFRSRGDVREPSIVSAGRDDLLRDEAGLAVGAAHDHGRRVGAADAEPGDLPVTLGRTRGAPRRRAREPCDRAGARHQPRQRVRRDPGEPPGDPQRLPAAHRVDPDRTVGGAVPAGAGVADLAGPADVPAR